jgi:hypothetical protein
MMIYVEVVEDPADLSAPAGDLTPKRRVVFIEIYVAAEEQ